MAHFAVVAPVLGLLLARRQQERETQSRELLMNGTCSHICEASYCLHGVNVRGPGPAQKQPSCTPSSGQPARRLQSAVGRELSGEKPFLTQRAPPRDQEPRCRPPVLSVLRGVLAKPEGSNPRSTAGL